MTKRWDDDQKFMVLDDSYWINTDGDQWDVMHGSHTIYLKEDDCFYNNYSWNDGPQFIGKLDEAVIMTSKFIYSVTDTDGIPEALLSHNEWDRCYEEIQWRMKEAAEKMQKRNYIVV
ncbi:MAG: hypothetical protein JXR12_06240 [Neptunomonas phycophila]|uniref:hypothetical protein n=1 Tax=Neptunomonas phycophila TaxID=1572645 RepID=UPI003B8D2868